MKRHYRIVLTSHGKKNRTPQIPFLDGRKIPGEREETYTKAEAA